MPQRRSPSPPPGTSRAIGPGPPRPGVSASASASVPPPGGHGGAPGPLAAPEGAAPEGASPEGAAPSTPTPAPVSAAPTSRAAWPRQAEGQAARPSRGHARDRSAAPEGTAPPPSPTAIGAAALEAALRLAGEAHAENTRRAYRADWAHFARWCEGAGFAGMPAPPEAVAAFLAAHAGALGRASLRRRLAAIAQAHRAAGHTPSPTEHPGVRATLRGLLRRHGAPPRRAAALGAVEIRALAEACARDPSPAGLRDRALLLLGYAGALRRAELVAVEAGHLVFGEGGLRLLIPRSKTDAEGAGAWLAIPLGRRRITCPVRALRDWLARAGIASGPVFRALPPRVAPRGPSSDPARALHADGVRRVLLKRAAEAGVAAPALERLSPHGLRAGFVTEAYRAGARDEEIMEHTRHRDARTMRGYVRRARLGALGSAARRVGL